MLIQNDFYEKKLTLNDKKLKITLNFLIQNYSI